MAARPPGNELCRVLRLMYVWAYYDLLMATQDVPNNDKNHELSSRWRRRDKRCTGTIARSTSKTPDLWASVYGHRASLRFLMSDTRPAQPWALRTTVSWASGHREPERRSILARSCGRGDSRAKCTPDSDLDLQGTVAGYEVWHIRRPKPLRCSVPWGAPPLRGE